MARRLVVLESPFAGLVERNLRYLRACVRDALLRDESPIASHGLYTQPGVLDDRVPEERELGMAAGREWISVADAVVVCVDFGISSGMERAIDEAKRWRTRVEHRNLNPEALAAVVAGERETYCGTCGALYGIASSADSAASTRPRFCSKCLDSIPPGPG